MMDVILIVVFIAVMTAPLLVQSFGGLGTSLTEKRELALAPRWPHTLNEFRRFPAKAESYLSDHFGLRAELIAANSYVRYRLGASSFPSVLVGRNGWLYLNDDPDFLYSRGLQKFPEAAMREWLGRMDQRAGLLAAMNCRFLILPAPRKETIYPEHLPYSIQSVTNTEFDQFVEASRTNSNFRFIDVRRELKERKKTAPLYNNYDTHWNAQAAFIAYLEIVKNLKGMKLGPLAMLQPDQLTLHPAPPGRVPGDLALMLGIEQFVTRSAMEYLPETGTTETVQFLSGRTDPDSPQLIITGIKNAPTLFFVRDSFGNGLLPYFRDSFSMIIVTHFQDGTFPSELIEKFHPDVFLIEVQERGTRFM